MTLSEPWVKTTKNPWSKLYDQESSHCGTASMYICASMILHYCNTYDTFNTAKKSHVPEQCAIGKADQCPVPRSHRTRVKVHLVVTD